MSAEHPSIHRRGKRFGRLAGRAGGAVVAILAGSALAASGASAQVAGHAPNTVMNFCHFNPGLGHVYLGRAAGEDYAAWDIFNGNRFNYYAFDTNGDTHVDVVAYVNQQLVPIDIGFCSGQLRGKWYSAQRIRQQSQAANSGSHQTSASTCAATPGCEAFWNQQLFDASSGDGSLSGIDTNPETGNPDGM